MKKRFSLGSYFRRIYLLLILFFLIPLFLVGTICFKLMSDRTYESFRSRQEMLADDLCASAEELIRHAEDELINLALSDPEHSILDTSPDLKLHDTSDALSDIVRRNSIVRNSFFLQRATNSLLSSTDGIYDFTYYYDTEWIEKIDYRPLLRRHSVRVPADSKYLSDDYFISNHNLSPVLSLSYGSIYSDMYLINISVDALRDNLVNSYSLTDSNTVLKIYGTNAPFCKYYARSGDRITLSGSMYHGLLGYSLEYDYDLYRSGESLYVTALCIIAAILAVCSFFLAGYAAETVYAPVSRLWIEVDASRPKKRLFAPDEADEIELLKEAFREINLDKDNAQRSAAIYKDVASSAALSMFLETGMPKDSFLDYAGVFSADDTFRLTVISSDTVFPESTVRILNLYLNGHGRNLAAPLSKGRIGILTVADKSLDVAELINNVLVTAAGLQCTIVTASEDLLLNEVPSLYRQLLEYIGRAEFFGITDRILTPIDFPDTPSDPVWSSEVNVEAGIIRAVINNDSDSYNSIIDNLFSQLELMPIAYFKSVLQAVLLTVEGELKIAKRLGHDILEDISVLDNCEGFVSYFTNLFEQSSTLYTPNESAEQKHCSMAREILEREYARDIDVLSVAEMLSLSYPYLSKIFKNCYGTTLSDYLNSYRIDRSCELLAGGNDTLETIAAAVGYNNTQSFQRFFKKYKGMTPTEYRRSISSGKEGKK